MQKALSQLYPSRMARVMIRKEIEVLAALDGIKKQYLAFYDDECLWNPEQEAPEPFHGKRGERVLIQEGPGNMLYYLVIRPCELHFNFYLGVGWREL